MALLSPHHIGSLSSQTIDIDCLCCQSTGLFVRHDSYSYGERQPVRAVHTSEPVGGSVSRVSRPGFRSSASRWRLPSVALQTKTVFVTVLVRAWRTERPRSTRVDWTAVRYCVAPRTAVAVVVVDRVVSFCRSLSCRCGLDSYARLYDIAAWLHDIAAARALVVVVATRVR